MIDMVDKLIEQYKYAVNIPTLDLTIDESWYQYKMNPITEGYLNTVPNAKVKSKLRNKRKRKK